MSRLKEKQNKAKFISELLRGKIKSRAELMAKKRKLAKKYGVSIVASSEIIAEYKKAKKFRPGLEKVLRRRSVRTMSGIAPVAVLTKPYPCPGKCAYCPTEPDVPQSYLSNEPAVMRAIRCGFDPYKQVRLRLSALEANGHEPTKIELIVIGGTWSVLPEAYKYWYIAQCFKAANEHGGKFSIFNFQFSKNLIISKLKEQLQKEQKKNESAKYKIIGITLETRPDYINDKELLEMRELGATRVELGVQAIDDKILKLNQRGHGVAEVARATELLKNYGFKVTYHIMPGLPGSTAKKDLMMFKKLFTDERFQPDQLKFYPTVVTRGSLLYKWWRAGKYKPYSDKVLQGLIVACKKSVPPYVRIIRLIRDIPGESIMAGNMITNLRQMMKQRGAKCRCIRCREAGERQLRITPLRQGPGGQANYELRIIKYQASGGKEYFLSFESKDGDVLYGFCRLRLGGHNKKIVISSVSEKSLKDENGVYKGFLPSVEMTNQVAMIRELHVYGELVSVGGNKKIQHAGLGKLLMLEAESIARKQGYKKMAVIAGVGVRGYYRKLGYRLESSYMVRSLI